ncbi:hypothetical protein [Methylomonas koyamae]|uniref:hypothetical protein n=1 Tax=Methylomonas koyamae TaxID=702114 RepID=UPI0012F623CB|nr:hypothetical protein [Methylomonas koyamae]
MKILLAFISLLLYSASPYAALQFNYGGDFVNFISGTFSGQMTLNAFAPNYVDSAPGDLRLIYTENTSSSLLINNQPFSLDNHIITAYFLDDEPAISEANVADRGFAGIIPSIIHDTLTISMASLDNQYSGSDLVSGAEFLLTAFFDRDTFNATDLESHDYQGLLNLPEPRLFVLEVNRKLGSSEDFRGAGIVTNSNVQSIPLQPVPLPGAIWLMGSALACVYSRPRKAA